MTQFLPIYDTYFTGFLLSWESSSRFACSSSSAESMRLQLTFPRCCIYGRKPDEIQPPFWHDMHSFLDVSPFIPAFVTLLFPVRHSGMVELTKDCVALSASKAGLNTVDLRKHLGSWNCKLHVNCIRDWFVWLCTCAFVMVNLNKGALLK